MVQQKVSWECSIRRLCESKIIEDISFIRSWIKRVIPCFPFSRVDFLIFVNLCQFYINHERREEGEGGKRGQINE